jgi:hypothetical protein
LCCSPVLNNDRGAQEKIPPRLADADIVFVSSGLNQDIQTPHGRPLRIQAQQQQAHMQ